MYIYVQHSYIDVAWQMLLLPAIALQFVSVAFPGSKLLGPCRKSHTCDVVRVSAAAASCSTAINVDT